jgi:hypothetical protein
MNPAIRALSPDSTSDRVEMLPSLVAGVGVAVAVAVAAGVAVAVGVGVATAVGAASVLPGIAEKTAQAIRKALVTTLKPFRGGNIEPDIPVCSSTSKAEKTSG